MGGQRFALELKLCRQAQPRPCAVRTPALRPTRSETCGFRPSPGSRRREVEGSPIRLEEREMSSCTMASLICSQFKLSNAYIRNIRQASLPYASTEDGASIFKGTDVVEAIDTEEAPQIPILQSDQDVVEVLTEMLTWHWKSPVWLVAPVVYEGYRVLQLMRGLQLAGEITAPGWMVQSLRGLVSWWVLVLGIQLMRVAWFAGLNFANNSRFPLDEDDLPPNGGNPHPFNGEVLPGEPEWVQHWADEQLLQGAFPVDLAPEENPHLIHVMDPPAAADDAWEAWPAQPPQDQAIEQPQDAVSAQMSGVSNQHTSDSIGTSQAVQSSPVSPERIFPKPLVTAVFKRRARHPAPTAQAPSAVSVSTLGLRRSARLRNKQRGFRVSFSRKQYPNASVQDPPTAGTTRLELPVNPTVEDFAQASVAGMAHAPLTIDQIQHRATHYCGLLAAQVTSDELLRDPTVDSQIVPVAAIPAVDNVDT
ncbi:hypothetical protein GUJ93_ZPchr0014g46543 [Zizania palustris]|uniref:Uncharacterized protein n=1 Tax=Zizania palustris TaxID=103762 RepID=A0A8J5TBZ0_ZIZPA|nr:hypothetical protein GUJ93_ZPchr0014g46543 [Zizania palustris]